MDVEFNAYNDTRKKIYEVLPCIFEPRSNVPVDRCSVYLLLSTMRTGKKNNALKYKATEKTSSQEKTPSVYRPHTVPNKEGWMEGYKSSLLLYF